MGQLVVVILLPRYHREASNKRMPINPNSRPLNGRIPTKPPIPKKPKSPNAHDGQAGASNATTIPGVPAAMPISRCRLKRKYPHVAVIPASKEMTIKLIIDVSAMLVNVPPIRDTNKTNEKS